MSKAYFDDPRVNQSILKDLRECVTYYRAVHVNKTYKPKTTEVFTIGKAVDCLVTQPENWERDFLTVERRTKKVREENPGKTLLTQSQTKEAMDMANKVKKQPVMKMFMGLEKQVEIYTDKRKAMLDFLGFTIERKKEVGIIADLKTLAKIKELDQNMAEYDYRFQLAFYRMMAKTKYPHIKKWRIYIIAIDKTPSHQFKVVEVMQDRFRYIEEKIDNIEGALEIAKTQEIRMKPGICTKCPAEIDCPYALFYQTDIEKV